VDTAAVLGEVKVASFCYGFVFQSLNRRERDCDSAVGRDSCKTDGMFSANYLMSNHKIGMEPYAAVIIENISWSWQQFRMW
jgi:hypothetical protein